jgi:hypothetical protein
MLIPSLLKSAQVSFNDDTNLIQLVTPEAVIVRKLDRIKPELTHHSFAANMKVPRFMAIIAVEIEPIRTRDAWNSGHAESHCSSATAGNR